MHELHRRVYSRSSLIRISALGVEGEAYMPSP